MDWILISAMAFAAWAIVSVTGNERQRQLENAVAEALADQPALPEPAAAEPTTH